MKEQILKWIKRYGVTIWLIAATLALAVSVSYAAYVNLDIKKYVLSTGKGNQAFFSSNYLYLMDNEKVQYSSRRVPSTKETGAEFYTFPVIICNHVYGNPELVNLDDITYKLQVTLLPNGGALPTDLSGITVNGAAFSGETMELTNTLTGAVAQEDTYTFRVPDSLKEKVIFQIVAAPADEDSLRATNNQKLAALITIADRTVTNGWSGRFLDDIHNAPRDYSGFNYEISGAGEGTVTLTWSGDILRISPWFTPEGITWGTGTCSFPVGGENSPTAYQLQFYIQDKDRIPNDWPGMESQVEVAFAPKQSTGTTESASENVG